MLDSTRWSRLLRSRKAQLAFVYSSWIMVCTGLFMLFMLTPWFEWFESHPRADMFLRVLVSPIAVVCAPAALIIFFGMIAFCLSEDRSPVASKVLWFALFLSTGFFGAVVYFFAVYKKQVLVTESTTAQ